jgi:hypothetical protein
MARKTAYYASAVEAARLNRLTEKTINHIIGRGQLKAEKSSASHLIKLTGQAKQPPTLDALLLRIRQLEES